MTSARLLASPTLAAHATLALAALLLSACGQKVVAYPVSLVTKSCGATSPLADASHLRFRILGDGMEPLVVVSPVNSRELEIPEIPAGTRRAIEVRAYDGDPSSGGRILSVGRSPVFDVPDAIDPAAEPPPKVNLFLRRVGEFVMPSLGEAPETCVRMITPRAGHTATLLQDGRVFIAGGFQLSQNGVRAMLANAEIFNPATGGFEQAPELGLLNSAKQFSLTPRAFHTATLLANGQVFLAGGEVVSGASTFALKSALVYDPVERRYGGLELQAARGHHGAAADEAGRVLLVGGRNQGAAVDTVEWYDPTTAQTRLVDGEYPRMGMSVAPVQNGKFIAVAGGSDGATLMNEIRFYSHQGGTFAPSTATAHLRQLRSGAGIAGFQDANQLLLVGGYASADESGAQPVASSEIVSTGSTFKVADGPAIAPRGDVCAALLADGRVLTVGGRGVDDFSLPKSSSAVELVTPSPSGNATVLGMPSLAVGRHLHSCTTLTDGSVMVLGGLSELDGAAQLLQDAWIFMPMPVD